MSVKREFSAGGIVYRRQKGKLQWLLVKHSSYQKWGFPKGRIGDQQKETAEETARREVQEEGGVKAKIIQKIPQKVQYFYVADGQKIFKTVTFYLMEYQSGNPANHDWEMADARWFTTQEAKKHLGFKNEKEVFKAAQKLLQEISKK